MAKEFISPDNVHAPAGSYSHCVKAGNTIYTAGQVGLGQNGALVGKGDFVAQFEQTLENLKRVLDAAGATMADIVHMTWVVSDYSKIEEVGEVRMKYFKPPFPAIIATQGTFGHPDVMVEMTATAVVE